MIDIERIITKTIEDFGWLHKAEQEPQGATPRYISAYVNHRPADRNKKARRKMQQASRRANR